MKHAGRSSGKKSVRTLVLAGGRVAAGVRDALRPAPHRSADCSQPRGHVHINLNKLRAGGASARFPRLPTSNPDAIRRLCPFRHNTTIQYYYFLKQQHRKNGLGPYRSLHTTINHRTAHFCRVVLGRFHPLRMHCATPRRPVGLPSIDLSDSDRRSRPDFSHQLHPESSHACRLQHVTRVQSIQLKEADSAIV